MTGRVHLLCALLGQLGGFGVARCRCSFKGTHVTALPRHLRVRQYITRDKTVREFYNSPSAIPFFFISAQGGVMVIKRWKVFFVVSHMAVCTGRPIGRNAQHCFCSAPPIVGTWGSRLNYAHNSTPLTHARVQV